MKKFLLSCFLAFGISATAQITVNETFESSPVTDFTISGGYQPNRYIDGGCGGDNGGYGSNIYGTTTANKTVNIIYTKPAAITANGKKIDVSLDYSTFALEGVGGAFTVSYSKANTGNTWTILGTVNIPATNPDIVCKSFTGTIPESADVSGAFRLRIQAVADGVSDFYFFVDNVKLSQQTLVAPSCATVTLPTNGVNPNNSISASWLSVAGATGYKVYVGTSAGNYDVANGTLVNATIYNFPALLGNTNYFVKVVSTNAIGDAVNCVENTFTTGASAYCDDVTNSASDHTSFEKIGNVTVSDINNSSTGTGAYENFSAIVGTVEQGKSYPISVSVSTFDSDLTSVWIDLNKNNIFEDSEKTVLTATEVATGSISIPADALLGNVRMRVRTSYITAPTPCGTISYGQAEDYTLNVTTPVLAASEFNQTAVSIYPNPFTDILKISNVKGVKSISVNDVSGRQVKSLAPSAELDLSTLKTGLYIVNLKMEDGTVKTFKAIKK